MDVTKFGFEDVITTSGGGSGGGGGGGGGGESSTDPTQPYELPVFPLSI